MKKDRNALEDLLDLIVLLDDDTLDKLGYYSDSFGEKITELRTYWGSRETREPWGVCVVLTRFPNEGPQVLVVHGPKGVGFPGGKPFAGETPLTAGYRELFEETGFAASRDSLETGANVIVADNGVPTYFLHEKGSTDLSERVVDGFESKEGVTYWAPPSVLIGEHARFPKYNREVLTKMGLL